MEKTKDTYQSGDAIVIDIGGRNVSGTVTRNLGYRLESATEVGTIFIGTQDPRIVTVDALAAYNAAKGQ